MSTQQVKPPDLCRSSVMSAAVKSHEWVTWRFQHRLRWWPHTGYLQTLNIWHDQEWFPLILICADYTKYFAILNSKLEYEGKVDNHWSLTRFQSLLFWIMFLLVWSCVATADLFWLQLTFRIIHVLPPVSPAKFLWFPVGVAQSQLQRYNLSVSCG